MLSQAIWTSQELEPDCGGWFCKSQEEWTEETGLSRWEQETARRVLREAGFLDERRAGMPARLWYRVRSERVWQALRAQAARAVARASKPKEGHDTRYSGTGPPDLRAPADLAEELALIWPLLGRHIAFHRRLVDLTASVKAALLLSQSIYWTRHGRDIAASGGWFFKTSEQWERETGLTAREQASARNTLRGLGILDERRLGIPARLHFRLALDRLAVALGAPADQGAMLIDWEDAAAVARLLGPTVAYHRSLATVGGGVHAGLLLSRALHLTRLESKKRPHGWIRRSVADWTRRAGSDPPRAGGGAKCPGAIRALGGDVRRPAGTALGPGVA